MAVVFSQPIASHGGLNWDTNLEAALTELKTKANRADQGIPGADLNSITEGGVYYGSSLANSPNGTGNGFLVQHMVRPDGFSRAQFAINLNGDQAFFRRYINNAYQPWRRLLSDAEDSGWVTSSTGITSPGNWTINNAKYRNLNGVVALAVSVTRTVSAITAANAAGIVPGIALLTLPAALIPAQTNGVLQTVGATSTVAAAAEVLATGVVSVTNLAPSQGIPVGGVLDMMGTYLL